VQEQKIVVPDIGDFKDVAIIEVHVAVGDMLEKEASIITLETDKASIEVPTPAAGKVQALHVKVGDKVSQGSLLLTLSVAADKTAAPVAVAPPVSSDVMQIMVVPDIGDFKNVEVIEVRIKAGDTIEMESALIVLETEKASIEVPAAYAGTIDTVYTRVGDRVSQGDKIATVRTHAGVISTPTVLATAPVEAARGAVSSDPLADYREAPATQEGEIYAGPATRRLARELSVDLRKVKGTGPKGRMSTADLHTYIKQAMAGSVVTGNQGGLQVAPWPVVDFSKFGETETVPLSRIQKLSAKGLHRNWVRIPHVTQFDDADITELEAFRQSQKQLADSVGVKLTLIIFLMKAIMAGLREFPRFNSALSPDETQLIQKRYFHIGVAVDTPEGLVVPVIRNVDTKSAFQLAKELGELSDLARKGQLRADQMQGGCFTISSLGGIGGTAFTPIINAPEVAILGVSKSRYVAVYQNGAFVPRLMLPMSLSYDHRVIDGADAARFITYVSRMLTNIQSLLLI